MNPEAIEQAANLLANARRNHSLVDAIPDDIRPQNLSEAYAIADRLVELLGAKTGGWFCACTNESIQTMLGLAEPYYARLLNDYIFETGVTLQSSDFPPIVLECEFGFRLDHDLPTRSTPYSRTEVEAAIATVHPTIEVVAGHLRNWPEQNVFSVIADNGTDGALVFGEGVENWHALNLVEMLVDLRINGETVRTGMGANVLGDPLAAMVWLANARARDGDGLRAGDIHNTGTATDIVWVNPGDHATAYFSGLGDVSLSIA
ncbi:MAG: fumarylacetoacetate hydrolase family protein [Pseudomonadota bacterium]